MDNFGRESKKETLIDVNQQYTCHVIWTENKSISSVLFELILMELNNKMKT